MRTLSVFFAGLSLMVSVSASASTLNEIANMQLTLEKAEYEKKLSELRRAPAGLGAAPAATALAPGAAGATGAAESFNPVLKGVYGLGKRLYAIVDMGGTEVEFSTGDTYFGYRALSISAHETVLTKLDSKGRAAGKLHRLRLTGAGDMSAVRNNLPPLPSVPGTSEFSPQPVSLPAATGQTSTKTRSKK